MSVRSVVQQNGEGLLEWLLDVDETGGLDQYRRTISQLYSSPSQVISAYTVNGGSRPIFDTQFFEDMGVVDVRHRRLFQRWFDEQCSRGAQRKAGSRGPSSASAPVDARDARERTAKRGGRDAEARTLEPRARSTARPGEQHASDNSGMRSRVVRPSAREEDALGDRTSESGQDSESGRSWGSRSWWDGSGGWGCSGGWRGKDDWARGSSSQWWGGDHAGSWNGPSGARSPPSPAVAGADGGFPENPPAAGAARGGAHVLVERESAKGKASARSSKVQESDSKRPSAGPLDEWLLDLNRSGALLRYRSPLEDFFDDPQQIFLAYTTPYAKSGISEMVLSLDHNFFQEAGVVDASHRRIFERWFAMQIETSSRERGGADSRSEQMSALASEGPPLLYSKDERAVRKWGPGAAQSVPAQTQHKPKSQVSPASSSTNIAAEGQNQSDAGCVVEKASDELEESEDDSCGATGDVFADKKGARTNVKTESQMRPAETHGARPEAGGPTTIENVLEMEKPNDGRVDMEDLAESPSNGAHPRSNVTIIQRTPDTDALPSTDQIPSEEQSGASPSKVAAANSKSPEDSSKPDPSFASKLQKAREAASSLPRADPRKHTCVTLLGHVAAGKTELLASLMLATGDWDRRTAEKFLKERRDAGAKSASETSTQRCATEGRRFTLFDAPGQKRCVAEAWSAVSQSDTAILVVSARAGEFEAGLAKGGQTREHAVLAKCAGMDSLIVAVNKMDDGNAKWSNLRYMEVRAEMGSALRTTGFYDDQVTYIPICALSGANVGSDEDEGECEACAGWYSNGSLLENIESAFAASRDSQGPLRISVTGRDKGKGKEQIIGRVEQGTLDVGAHVVLVPPGPECGVRAIEVNGKDVRQAEAGEIVSLRLLGGIPSIGHALTCVEEPLRGAAKFKAQVRLVEMVDDPPVITAGFRCVLHLHGATEEVELSKLIEAVDPRSKKKEASPKILRAPMVALVVIVLNPGREVPVDCNGGRFARFCLRVDGGTIAIGKIAELPKVR